MTETNTIESVSPPTIGSVLFGSEARGDFDEFSDRDICVFFDSITMLERPSVRARLAEIYSTRPPGICMYSKPIIESMARKGSLFMWHLKLESRILYDPKGFVANLFESVVPYSGYATDMRRYEQIALGVSETLRDHSLTEADLHALFVAWRNTCLLLTMSRGTPVFARSRALQVAQDLFPTLPLNSEAYRILTEEHLRYTRNAQFPIRVLTRDAERELVAHVLAFIRESKASLKL
jgi:predicted nucleotidyltransferase